MEQRAKLIVSQNGFELGQRLNPEDKRDRFYVFSAQKGNKKYVFKLANDNFCRELSNEIWWNTTLTRLIETNPATNLRPPAVFYTGPNWYIGEYFHGSPLMSDSHNNSEAAACAQNLADILVWLDGIALQPATSEKPIYEDSHSAPYTNLWNKVDGWMERPLSSGLITQDHIDKARKLIDRYRPNILPSLQHGDFVPWHMYYLENNKIGLIDGEHASLVRPRYYDLAYLYTRLCTRLESFTVAVKILRFFLGQTKINKLEFTQAWLPVITLRSLGMYNDAMIDLEHQDYRQQATELLERCLSEKLDSFLEG